MLAEKDDDAWEIEIGIRDFVAREERRGHEFSAEAGPRRRVSGLMVALDEGLITRRDLGYGFQYAKDYGRFLYEFRCPSTLDYQNRVAPTFVSDLILSAGFRVRRAEASLSPAQRQLVRWVCGENRRVSLALLAHLKPALHLLKLHYNEAWSAENEDLAALAQPIADLRALGIVVRERFAMGGNYGEIGAQPLLRAAQGGLCALCRRSFVGPLASIEHVVPASARGFRGPGNLLLTHERCNSERGAAMPDGELLRELRRVNMLLGWGRADDYEDPEDKWQILTEGLARLPMANDDDPALPAHYPAPTSEVRGLGMSARDWARRKVALERTLKRLEKLRTEPATPTPTPRHRPVMIAVESPREADWSALLPAKPSRSDDGMAQSWLAGAGVLKSNRDIRHLGVQAKAANKVKAKKTGKVRKRVRRRGNS